MIEEKRGIAAVRGSEGRTLAASEALPSAPHAAGRAKKRIRAGMSQASGRMAHRGRPHAAAKQKEEADKMEKILVVDDNREIVDSLGKLLAIEGYEILTAYDGMEALEKMESAKVDLILLDVMMPRLNGLSALMKIREKHNIPAIILSAKTEESDKVSGLSLGADDYIEKPYNPAELLARVKAQLRRYKAYGGSWAGEAQGAEGSESSGHRAGSGGGAKDKDVITNGGLVLDDQQKQLFVDGEAVRLTATEYKIVELLMRHPGQVFSAEQIYENVWNEDASYSVENTVMVHIRHIREKIEVEPKNPRYVKVVWGIGYKMEKY